MNEWTRKLSYNLHQGNTGEVAGMINDRLTAIEKGTKKECDMPRIKVNEPPLTNEKHPGVSAPAEKGSKCDMEEGPCACGAWHKPGTGNIKAKPAEPKEGEAWLRVSIHREQKPCCADGVVVSYGNNNWTFEAHPMDVMDFPSSKIDPTDPAALIGALEKFPNVAARREYISDGITKALSRIKLTVFPITKEVSDE